MPALASAPPHLPGVFAALAPLLDHYGYLAVFGLVFLEDFGVPVPGETVLIAAAVYAGAGRLDIVTVGVLGVVAATLGDNVGYLIGYLGGRPLVLRLGRYVRLTDERFSRAEGFFNRHGGKIITVARFIEGLRQANGIIAGVARLRWPRFLLFNLLGAILWAAAWVTIGDLAGRHLTGIYRAVTRYELYVLAALVLLVAALVVRHVRRRRTAPSDPPAGE